CWCIDLNKGFSRWSCGSLVIKIFSCRKDDTDITFSEPIPAFVLVLEAQEEGNRTAVDLLHHQQQQLV
ncbi:MAG: hypothetical protein ACKO96_01265, partial [Flammeovirgaceae bacterium]